MVQGDMVTFKTAPTVNTPGATAAAIEIGIEFAGVVLAAGIKENGFLGSDMLDETQWCEVLWPDDQVTRCYKGDLKVWKLRRRRSHMRCVKNEKSHS